MNIKEAWQNAVKIAQEEITFSKSELRDFEEKNKDILTEFEQLNDIYSEKLSKRYSLANQLSRGVCGKCKKEWFVLTNVLGQQVELTKEEANFMPDIKFDLPEQIKYYKCRDHWTWQDEIKKIFLDIIMGKE